MFAWRSVLVFSRFVLGGCAILFCLTGAGAWYVFHAQNALRDEQMSRAGLQDEIASLRVTVHNLTVERDELRVQVQGAHDEVATLQKEALFQDTVSGDHSPDWYLRASEIVWMDELAPLGDGCRYFVCTTEHAGKKRQSVHKARVNVFEAALLSALKTKFNRGIQARAAP